MTRLIQGALRQEAFDANRLHHGTLSVLQRHRLSITIEALPRPHLSPTPSVQTALEQFGGAPDQVTWLAAAKWARFFARLKTGRSGLVGRSIILDGIGWDFIPSFIVYAPSRESSAMPMVSFIYVPAAASDDQIDTATAGHLLALALEQFRRDPGRRLYMPRVIAKHEATNRALVVDARIDREYLAHVAEGREVLDVFGPYLPGGFHVRTSGWLDCGVEDVRRCLFGALVFPFDGL